MKPFNKILLINLAISLAIAIFIFLAPTAFGKSSDAAFYALLAGMGLIGLQALTCLISCVVFFVKQKTNHGLGFLISIFMVGAIGFGTCSATLMRF